MNAPRSRVLDSVIDLLDAHGITMAELESRLAGRDGVGVTLGEFLDDELATLTFNTRKGKKSRGRSTRQPKWGQTRAPRPARR
jgi:hypothetical protein